MSRERSYFKAEREVATARRRLYIAASVAAVIDCHCHALEAEGCVPHLQRWARSLTPSALQLSTEAEGARKHRPGTLVVRCLTNSRRPRMPPGYYGKHTSDDAALWRQNHCLRLCRKSKRVGYPGGPPV